jgi:glycosyltransferase involved in cell wall biosynthesis
VSAEFDCRWGLEIAISTNQHDIGGLISRLSEKYPYLNFLIVWQTAESSLGSSVRLPENIRVILSNSEGLSVSRNIALRNAKKKYVLLSDDDVDYVENLEEIVKHGLIACQDAAVFIFRVKTQEGALYKKYSDRLFQHNRLSVLRVSSIEIVINLDLVAKSHVKFDSGFGLGARYPLGEEAIFLSDVLKSGLDILGIPGIIVVHDESSSSGSYNEIYMRARGALFFRIFGRLAYPLLLLFIVKNYKNISRYMSVDNAIRVSFSEGIGYRKEMVQL